MKYRFFVLFCLIYSCDLNCSDVSSIPPANKQKIVIFMSGGGSGHISVSQRLQEDLGEKYDITIVNLIEDLLYKSDPVKKMSWGKCSGEDLYNYLLRHNRTWLVNQMATTGARGIRWIRNSLAQQSYDYIKEHEFDLVISCMHFVNGFLLKACKRLDVPFLVVTTDLNSSSFVNDIYKPDYKKFRYTLPFEDPLIRDKISQAHIPDNQIKVTGFAIRKNFFRPHDKHTIKKDFSIPEDRPVVMILMGGAGSRLSYKYAKMISHNDNPMHLLVCIGRNESVRKNLQRLKLPSHITMSVISFTERISDLMSVSDVFITKAGSVSFSEGLYMNLPTLLDRTSGALEWESLNYDILEKHNLGHVVKVRRDVNKYLDEYIANPSNRDAVRNNIASFKKKDFGQEIRPLVNQMIDQSPWIIRESIRNV